MRSLLDSIETHFKKGGKLARYYPLYEALDTFLYTRGKPQKPHHMFVTALI